MPSKAWAAAGGARHKTRYMRQARVGSVCSLLLLITIPALLLHQLPRLLRVDHQQYAEPCCAAPLEPGTACRTMQRPAAGDTPHLLRSSPNADGQVCFAGHHTAPRIVITQQRRSAAHAARYVEEGGTQPLHQVSVHCW
jgi:hypothetical protein